QGLPPEGKVPAIRQAYNTYAMDARKAFSARGEHGDGVQYTLLGQQNAMLQREADNRLELIHRLDAELRVLRERADLADVLTGIGEAIAQLCDAIAQQRAAITQLDVVISDHHESLR